MKDPRLRKSNFEMAFGGANSAAQALQFGSPGSLGRGLDQTLFTALQPFYESFQLRKIAKHRGSIKQLHMRIAKIIESIELLFQRLVRFAELHGIG